MKCIYIYISLYVLNVRDGIKSEYPSIVFLSKLENIHKMPFSDTKNHTLGLMCYHYALVICNPSNGGGQGIAVEISRFLLLRFPCSAGETPGICVMYIDKKGSVIKTTNCRGKRWWFYQLAVPAVWVFWQGFA